VTLSVSGTTVFSPTWSGSVTNNSIPAGITNNILLACTGGWGYTNPGPRFEWLFLNVSGTGVGAGVAATHENFDMLLTNAGILANVTSNWVDMTTNAIIQSHGWIVPLYSNSVVVIHTNRSAGAAAALTATGSVLVQ